MKFNNWHEINATFQRNTRMSFREFIEIMKDSGNLPQHLSHMSSEEIITEMGEYYYMKLEDE